MPGDGSPFEDDPIVRALKDADPAAGPDFDDWASSEAGQKVFARIVARRGEPASQPAARRRPLRTALVAAGAFIAVALVIVGVAIGLNDPGGIAVESTTTTIVLVDTADRAEVLDAVVSLAYPSSVVEHPTLPSDLAAETAERAQRFGVISPSEREWAASHGSVDRATFALWLWRGFGDRLTPVREVELADVGGLSEEVRNAILRVADAGLLDPSGKGLFQPDRALSAQEFDRAISELLKLLGF